MSKQSGTMLQRQGVSRTVRGNVPSGAHVEVHEWQNTGRFVVEISTSRPSPTPGWPPITSAKMIVDHKHALPFDEAIAKIGCPIDPRIEAYMFYNADTLRIWPHIGSDVYRAAAIYEKPTETIRDIRNHCLVNFRDGKAEVFEMEGANKPYRDMLADSIREFEKPHNQRVSVDDARGWLAWLISERLKDRFGVEPQILQSIVQTGSCIERR